MPIRMYTDRYFVGIDSTYIMQCRLQKRSLNVYLPNQAGPLIRLYVPKMPA